MTRRKNSGRKSFFTPAVPIPAPQAPAYAQAFPFDVGQAADAVPGALDVRIQLLSSNGATVAKAVLSNSAHPYNPLLEVTRDSKREPGDAYDAETGVLLAASRALHAVAAKMEKHAASLIREAENGKRKKARPAARYAWGEGSTAPGAGVTLHLPPDLTEADVPDSVKTIISGMFPDSVISYTSDESDDVPGEIAKAIAGFYNGKHAKDESDDEPIDPDLLNGRE